MGRYEAILTHHRFGNTVVATKDSRLLTFDTYSSRLGCFQVHKFIEKLLAVWEPRSELVLRALSQWWYGRGERSIHLHQYRLREGVGRT